MQILQRNFPTNSPAKKRDKKADANTTCEKHGAQKKIFFHGQKSRKKKNPEIRSLDTNPRNTQLRRQEEEAHP